MNNDVERAERFYEVYILGEMLQDLNKGIESNSKTLTVLGCLVYTEVIGHFLPPIQDENLFSKNAKKFYRCFYRLKSKDHLQTLEKVLKNVKGITKNNFYEQLRNSMTHSYFPQISRREEDGSWKFLDIEIALNSVDRNGNLHPPVCFDFENNKITIGVKNYVTELEEAVRNFYHKTFIEKDEDFQKAAVDGLVSITGPVIR